MQHLVQHSTDISATDALVLPLWDQGSIEEAFFFSILSEEQKDFLKAIDWKGKAESFHASHMYLPGAPLRHVVVIGMGDRAKYNHRAYIKTVRKVAMIAKHASLKNIAVCPEEFVPPTWSMDATLEAYATNMELAQYAFTTYKETPKEGYPLVERVAYISKSIEISSDALARGVAIGAGTNLARELANTPGGDMTPRVLAQRAREGVSGLPVTVTVLGEKEMTDLGMGAILGVSKGSVEEAQLIIMEYRGEGSAEQPIVFCGKGITFDSGGLHLKPSNGMDEMHLDMSGAAAVIGSITALARMSAPVHVIGICPAVENMVSGESYRPGDLLKSMSGKTIEIVSPDAEGRVVLADALHYAKRYNPSVVLDIATLTGAACVALGHHASGIFSQNDSLIESMTTAAEHSGDYVWRLPLWDEYEQDIKGVFGDYLNCGKSRDAGATNGAMFLYQFAKEFPQWAHIDIAPTMTTANDQFLAKGASGAGTRLLIQWAREHAQHQ